jgi:hypothetical protein
MSLLDAIETARSGGGVPYVNGTGTVIIRVSRLQLREPGQDPVTKKIMPAAFACDGVVLLADLSSRDPNFSAPRPGMVVRANVVGRFSDDPPVAACREAVAAAKTSKDGKLFAEAGVNKTLADKFVGPDQAGTGGIIKVLCNEKSTQKGGLFTQYTFASLDEGDVRRLSDAGAL